MDPTYCISLAKSHLNCRRDVIICCACDEFSEFYQKYVTQPFWLSNNTNKYVRVMSTVATVSHSFYALLPVFHDSSVRVSLYQCWNGISDHSVNDLNVKYVIDMGINLHMFFSLISKMVSILEFERLFFKDFCMVLLRIGENWFSLV